MEPQYDEMANHDGWTQAEIRQEENDAATEELLQHADTCEGCKEQPTLASAFECKECAMVAHNAGSVRGFGWW